MEPCIDLMIRAMKLVAEGKTIQPIRSGVFHPNMRGLLGMMPGYIGEPDWLGIKVTSVYPGNSGAHPGAHQGAVMLFDPASGTPMAFIEAGEITAIRTAAATAAATDVLARKDASTLGVFGYGEQARTHIRALPLVRRFEQTLVWGRDTEKLQRFCRAQSAELGLDITPARSAEHAATEADVLCLVTAAAEPIFTADWLRPGQHLNVVGSSIPSTSEIDVQTVARARYFVDYDESARVLAGDFRRARDTGVVTDEHLLGTVGDVLIGKVAGRRSGEDITLFKSLGMVSEDLVAADFVLKEAERLGVGVVVDW